MRKRNAALTVAREPELLASLGHLKWGDASEDVRAGHGESHLMATAEEAFGTKARTVAPEDDAFAQRSDAYLVLIAGGMHDPGPVACVGASCVAMVGTTDLTSAEIYDPATGKFSRTGSMATPRTGPTATHLWDGRVLVAGGFTNQGPWTDAELYQP